MNFEAVSLMLSGKTLDEKIMENKLEEEQKLSRAMLKIIADLNNIKVYLGDKAVTVNEFKRQFFIAQAVKLLEDAKEVKL